MKYFWLIPALSSVLLLACEAPQKSEPAPSEPPAKTYLSSWNDGTVKQSILKFVDEVSDSTNPNFVPVGDRIATFDNDGTLWCERPLYFQFYFVLDQIRAQAKDHPEWQDKQPFKDVIAGDDDAIFRYGVEGIVTLMSSAVPPKNVEDYDLMIQNWLDTARHPTTGKAYTDMVYVPMLELLECLRDHGFKTFIVSGGGLEFMRPWMNQVYGIPTDQVVGSYNKLEFTTENGKPVIIRQQEMDNFNDRDEKPLNIRRFIGKRPIAAFGNSDGDLSMLRYTAAGDGARLMMYVHHTDSVREWAYDRGSLVGGLDKGLDTARAKGWLVMDMDKDWNQVFPK
ncbi:haloacid dehalogenase-like hydrolase [bacterium SCSIO 12741]|nr:haloacid dehalogenase-like hydrolase [bacterium SCSIO 12741]